MCAAWTFRQFVKRADVRKVIMVKHNKMYKVYVEDVAQRMKEKGIKYSHLSSKFHLSDSKVKHFKNNGYATLYFIKTLSQVLDMDMEDIADLSEVGRIELLRVKNGLTIPVLADLVGESASKISMLERGVIEDRAVMSKLEEFFGEDIDEQEDYDYMETICKAVMNFSC